LWQLFSKSITKGTVTMKTIIRNETPSDYRQVENLIRESFWNVYRPGCLEHFVIHELRNDPAFVKELDFVMEQNGRIIGQNMFMHATIAADDGRTIPIMTMGPICIANDLKRQGYGKKLLDYSLVQQRSLAAVPSALKVASAFTAKAASVTHQKKGFATTGYRKVRMHLFSCVRN